MREHTKRNTKRYQTYLEEKSYIKQQKVCKLKGKHAYISIITANLTSLSDAARQWLSEQTADIILIQEHHLYNERAFGKIPGYTLVFSPAQKTIYSAREWETIGGVAILHKTDTFHLIKHKGIKQRSNWSSLHIQLEKGQELIVVTGYTKHGWEIDTIQTFSQVQDYLGTFMVPWVWGGAFNRSPEELLGKGVTIPAQAHTPKGEWSTCTVGRMIDYFLTPTCEHCPVDECTKK